jgi:hypothetical protein
MKRTKLSNGGTLDVIENGDKYYYDKNGDLHREDGPAVVFASGYKEWRIEGKLHRKYGPALVWATGDKEWYLNDKLHRKDGPAIEWYNGKKSWYLNGERIPCTTQEEFERLLKLKAFW